MPVTKTAKRALRSSQKKKEGNRSFMSRFEIALRQAQKTKSTKTIKVAISLADRAAKKNLIHANRAARLKSSLNKLAPKSKKSPTKKSK